MRYTKSLFTLLTAVCVVGCLGMNLFGGVAWQPAGGDGQIYTFENPDNWTAATYDPPAPSPELTPPGSDSVWFIDSFDGTITLTQPRTAATTKLGPGRIGGGDANQVAKLIIDTDVTITGQERDGTGAVNTNLREMRLGGDDTTPGDENFPLGMVIQRSGHFLMEYETDPLDSDLKLTGDKVNTGGAVWEVGGTAQFTLLDNLQMAEKAGVVGTGNIFRVRGSQVAGVNVGNNMLVLSRTSHWDLSDVNLEGFDYKQENRGKSIVEFVLDEGGVTPIEVGGDLAIGSEYTDIDTLSTFVTPGFLRVKLSEPTTAGSGGIDSGNELVLIRADNIGSRITNFPESQSQAGVFFDPDRAQSSFPHRVIDRMGTGTVISEYAGVTYTWDAVYDDNSLGLETIENALTLTNLVISDPGGSGIAGDFDDANGIDVNDANALQAAFGTAIGFADAQHMFDLNADGAIDALDLEELITHPGFANTSLTDFDLDGDTDGDDIATWQAGYGTPGALFTAGDADLDGDVDGADFLAIQRNFGSSALVTAVPEPASLVLAALTASLLYLRKRS